MLNSMDNACSVKESSADKKSRKPPNRLGITSKKDRGSSTTAVSLSFIISTRARRPSRILLRMAPASYRIPPIPEPIRSPSCSQRLLSSSVPPGGPVLWVSLYCSPQMEHW